MHVECVVCAAFPQPISSGDMRRVAAGGFERAASCSGNRSVPDFKVQEPRPDLSADFCPMCLMSVRHKASLCIQWEFSARTAERYSFILLYSNTIQQFSRAQYCIHTGLRSYSYYTEQGRSFSGGRTCKMFSMHHLCGA